jgi:inner membrane transporter RhtA
VLLLAAVFATMNLSLYSAIDRLGLGLAVTLEFLGPLTVALVTSRRRIDIGCALLAAAGVVTLTRPRPSTDYLGVGLALLAATCWSARSAPDPPRPDRQVTGRTCLAGKTPYGR